MLRIRSMVSDGVLAAARAARLLAPGAAIEPARNIVQQRHAVKEENHRKLWYYAAMAKRYPHIGSSFESWLDEQGIREEVTAAAIKAVKDERKKLDSRESGKGWGKQLSASC